MTQTMLLAFARAVGLVSRAPAFSHPSVPPVVRAGFALALAFAVAPHVAPARALDLVAFTLALAGEFAVGAAIGFGASLLYDGAYYGGRTVDDYLGVRGSVPGANVTSAQAFGRLWSSAFLIAFVLLDGWVPVVRAFAGSFDHVAAGTFAGAAAWTRFALSLPVDDRTRGAARRGAGGRRRGSLQLVLAAVARVVPRFSSFTLAFPATFAAAVLVTIADLCRSSHPARRAAAGSVLPW